MAMGAPPLRSRSSAGDATQDPSMQPRALPSWARGSSSLDWPRCREPRRPASLNSLAPATASPEGGWGLLRPARVFVICVEGATPQVIPTGSKTMRKSNACPSAAARLPRHTGSWPRRVAVHAARCTALCARAHPMLSSGRTEGEPGDTPVVLSAEVCKAACPDGGALRAQWCLSQADRQRHLVRPRCTDATPTRKDC